MTRFVVSLIFKDWSRFDFVISLLSFVALAIAFDSLSASWRVAIVVAGLTAAFCVKLVRQCWHYYQGYLKPIKVLGQVKGVGNDKSSNYVRVSNVSYMRPEMLLTLVTTGSGVIQDLCILRIVTSDDGQDCLCATLDASDQKLVDSYCADGNKLSNLFVVPVVSRPALLTLNN